MSDTQPLGRSQLLVPRLGMGAMTWGDPTGWGRFTPAKLAYGGAEGAEEEARAFDIQPRGRCDLLRHRSFVRLRRLRAAARGVVPWSDRAHRDQVPAGDASDGRGHAARAGGEPRAARTLHGGPVSASLPVQAGGHPAADDADGRCCRGGQDPGGWGEQLLGAADADRPRRAGRPGYPTGVQPGAVLVAAPPARDRRRVGHLPRVGRDADRLPAPREWCAQWQVPAVPGPEASGASCPSSAGPAGDRSRRWLPYSGRSVRGTAWGPRRSRSDG